MVKVISLSDEAYTRLKSMKGQHSFSALVLDLAEVRAKKKRSIMDFYGIWKENAEEWKTIEKKIYEDRKKFKLREYKL